MPKASNLINQRFGRLVVLYRCDYNLNNRPVWHCKCDCGNEKDIRARDLVSGKIQSCGCLRKEKTSEIGKNTIKIARQALLQDLTNKRFGRLVVKEFIKVEKNRRVWKCVCDCGNVAEVPTGLLMSGLTKSCGCLKSNGQEQIGKLLTQYGLPFETEKEFIDCQYPNTKGNPRFDFYVNNSYIIEYDGIQHFKEVQFFQLSLEEQQSRDTFKNNWCKQHNIPIIRIPYYHLKQLIIDDLLLEKTNYIL